MGHGWPGKIPFYGADVLQKRQRSHAGVRPYTVQQLRRDQGLGKGAAAERGGHDGAGRDRQQVRSASAASRR